MQTNYKKIKPLLFLFLLCLFSLAVTSSQADNTGKIPAGSIIINESGKYTLENDITHPEEAGIVILASSVTLDGQGYNIRPERSDIPSVGIWIAVTNESGETLSDISITNCSISNEMTGILSQGTDQYVNNSKFLESVNFVTLSDLEVINSTKGISLQNDKINQIRNITTRNNKDAITINSGTAKIAGCTLLESQNTGIRLVNTTDSEIINSDIVSQTGTGIIIDGISKVNLSENHLDNPVNIEDKSQNVSPIINVTTNESVPARDIKPEKPSVQKVPDIDIITAEPSLVPTTYEPVKSTITGTHAVIIGDTIPDIMKAGAQYQVSITLANDGSDNWNEKSGIGIRAQDTAAVYGPAWQVIQRPVPSKESYTFDFTITAPPIPGDYKLSYQSAREGQGVSVTFGRPYTKDIRVN